MSLRPGTLSSSESSRIQDWLDNITPPGSANSSVDGRNRATRPLKRKRTTQSSDTEELLTPPASQRCQKALKTEHFERMAASRDVETEPQVQNPARTDLSIYIPSQSSIHPHSSGSQSSTPSRKRRNGDNSTCNTSPSKKGIVELQWLEKPINIANWDSETELLVQKNEQIRTLLREAKPLTFIPRGIEAGVAPFLWESQGQILEEHLYNDPRSQLQLQCELTVLIEMLEDQSHLTRSLGNEPSWGERVWSRILSCAVKHTPDIRWHNITTALIEKEFRPCLVPLDVTSNSASRELDEASTTSRGTAIGPKLLHKIDYAVSFNPKETAAASIANIVMKCKKLGSPETINQIQHFDLIKRPIAVAIEAKTPQPAGGQIEIRQLTTWAAAWHKRMKRLQLCGMIDATPQKPLACLPLITIQGSKWFWHLAIDDIEKAEIRVSPVSGLLGATDTLYECYHLIAALRALMKWADGPYRAWWDEMLAGAASPP